MENEPNPAAESPAPPAQFTAVTRKPRLIWQGKERRPKTAEPVPAQTVEIIRPFYANPNQSALNLAYEGAPDSRLIWTNDNLVALESLLAGDEAYPSLEGKIDLIYIDPPFAVQSDFKINIEIENGVTDEKSPTLIEELAYRDTWRAGLDSYLSMMRDRLLLLKRLLAPTGSIYVHCDWHAGHYLKVLMDEVYGYENFKAEVIWKRTAGRADAGAYGAIHDTLFLYSVSGKYTFNEVHQDYDEAYIKSHYTQSDPDGRRYMSDNLTGAGPGPARTFGNKTLHPPSGRHWAYDQIGIDALMKQGRIVWTTSDLPRVKKYMDEAKGVRVNDVWTDISPINSQAHEAKGFPTQKPLPLLQRVIETSSNPGDLILDCFCGSGTTAVAAETMKDKDNNPTRRRWIAIDCGKFAIHTTRKRLIEANAKPFAVQNVGFYERGKKWSGIESKSAEAKRYRTALIELYGGHADDIEGFAFLHGMKGAAWIHVGPLDAPVTAEVVEAAARECAENGGRRLEVLTADIEIDFNRSDIEARQHISIGLKVIPQAALEEVRKRLQRKTKGAVEEDAGDSGLHFFSPPEFEVRITPTETGKSVTVELTRVNMGSLEDSLQSQNPKRRAEIKKAITDWKALVDYWAVDWEYNGQFFRNDWQTFRTRKNKNIALQAARSYETEATGSRSIAVKVTDIFGNDGLRVYTIEPVQKQRGA